MEVIVDIRAISIAALCGLLPVSGNLLPDTAQAAAAGIPSRGIPSSYQATLQHAAKTQGTVQTANRDRWRCFGSRCDGIVVRQFGVAACQALAHTQGAVTAFTFYGGGTTRQLSAAQLRQCNSSGQRARRVVVHVASPVPDTVRTSPLVLIGKPQAPDTIRTPPLVLVGKPQVPDMVRTAPLVLVGKAPVPDTIRTRPLNLVGKRRK